MAEAYSLGCAAAMPNATQTVDRFHVMQLFSKATDKVRAAEAKSNAERRALLKGTKYAWLKQAENLTERQAATRESPLSRAPQDRPGLRHDRGDARRLRVPGPRVRLVRARPARLLDDALERAGDEDRRQDRQEGARGVLNWWPLRSSNGFLESLNSLIQALKRASRGFRNVGYFSTMIFPRLGAWTSRPRRPAYVLPTKPLKSQKCVSASGVSAQVDGPFFWA